MTRSSGESRGKAQAVTNSEGALGIQEQSHGPRIHERDIHLRSKATGDDAHTEPAGLDDELVKERSCPIGLDARGTWL